MTKIKHTPLPWKHKGSDGKYLGRKSNWSADYDGRATITTSLPILSGKKTVALCVSVDKSWGDKTAQTNAEFIVKACNAHYDLIECFKILDGIADMFERNKTKEEFLNELTSDPDFGVRTHNALKAVRENI